MMSHRSTAKHRVVFKTALLLLWGGINLSCGERRSPRGAVAPAAKLVVQLSIFQTVNKLES
jgi:hypothetical protein